MKRLILARHAKSSWDNALLSDIDRPLNKRGKKNAPVMAQHLKQLGIQVDVILSSPANRAFTTAQHYADSLLNSSGQLITRDDIYMADERELYEIIEQVSNSVNCLMLVGHNPTMTSFANRLSGQMIANVPTCGVVVIDFEMEGWQEIESRQGRMRYFAYPKKLAA